jgi:hypothetical protein
MQLDFSDYRFHDLPDAAARFATATAGIEWFPSGVPGIDEVHDALFVPLGTGAARSDENRVGGLFNRNGEPVAAAILRRGDDPVSGHLAPSPLPQPVETVDEPVLYLGAFSRHFGHLLLEGLSHAWALGEVGVPQRVVMHDAGRFPRRALS